MSEIEKVLVAPSLSAPATKIRRIFSKTNTDFRWCGQNISLGIFFDGTYNNYTADKPLKKHSNIARLYDTYRDDKAAGYYRTYIPGVGTRFKEIGEGAGNPLGGGFGIGCESRVLYALTNILNTIHQSVTDVPMLSEEQVKALCRTQSLDSSISHRSDVEQLRSLGLNYGLRMPDFWGGGERDTILRQQASLLEKKLATRPHLAVRECFIDVFGFSRGAAEARVFCNWLDRVLVQGKLGGVTIRLRFLGIFDTVASAGFWAGTKAALVNGTASHSGWAASEFLRVPSCVENCVHMVAMHELRRNFPLDEVGLNGIIPPRTIEIAYPGTHSDVGGGYLPGELGASVGSSLIESDALKLSQIPLNHMLECAQKAGAPMALRGAVGPHAYDPFAIHPRLQKAYEDFLGTSTLAPKRMHEWLQPYITWRWQHRNEFETLSHVQRASARDRGLLKKFNDTFVRHSAVLESTVNNSTFLDHFAAAARAAVTADHEMLLLRDLDKEAQDIFRIAKAAAPTPSALHIMFDGFVHDSLAGFNMQFIEDGGHWRYRKAFRGLDEPGSAAPTRVSPPQREATV